MSKRGLILLLEGRAPARLRPFPGLAGTRPSMEANGTGLDTRGGRGLAAVMSDKLIAYAAQRGVTVPPPPHTAEVLGVLAASVYLHPVRATRKMPRELAYLETAQRLALPTSAGELAAWLWGEADRPLVGLLHGWEGHGAHLGAFAAPLVAAGFRVLTFDAPGHGESPGDECSAPLIGRLLLEMEKPLGAFHSFVAHSMGAAAAAMVATHGAQPRGMVFLAPPLSQLERIERVVVRSQLAPEAAAVFRSEVARRSGLSLEESDMHYVAKISPCPLLSLHDPADLEANYADTAGFVRAWRGARLVPCPGRGHFRLLSTPDVVRQGVDFLVSLNR